MTNASKHGNHAEQLPRERGWRRSRPIKRIAAMTGLLGLSVLAAGSSSGTAMTQALAYTRCMRSHGVSDYPDPTIPPGGGVAFQIHGGPGSDLDRDNPTFKAANQACRRLLPGGGQPPSVSAPEIAAEVRWARCMRSHGVPSFPDPNSQGAFDSAKFDEGSPAFQTAGNACKSLLPTGPTPVAPGQR